MMIAELDLQSAIELCRSEPELDRQVEFLHNINDCLPASMKVTMPSLLTNDFVERALDLMEERIVASKRTSQI